MEKTYSPKPAQHPVEYDIERTGKEHEIEITGLILKNHLPRLPFGIRFGEFELKVTDIQVGKNTFNVFVEGKEIVSPFVYNKPILTAPNGTWDKETDTENYEVNYKLAFESMMLEKLKEQGINL